MTEKNFHLEFDAKNAAFDGDPASEVTRILRLLADKIESGETGHFHVRDVNGNRIGEGFYVPESEED